ncbi:MAG: TetR/AcrR family transcriptional regulator [Lachnospiraceae bacterium]|nr:TetR/AcrR family transcriptional regulator [Lachnospiraceae bacterium]
MKKGEKRKKELLEIAYRMFITRGYENTSVDEIIAEAGIAKGTYYYYFESKEQTLEEVIGMMIDKEAEDADRVLAADITIPQKIIGIIAAMRPSQDEHPIEGALMQPENLIMHHKIRKKLIEKTVPLLSAVVEEGVSEGIFSCSDIPERVRMLLNLSNDTFNEGPYTERDTGVFIDVAEKLLCAESGTMGFIKDLIGQ